MRLIVRLYVAVCLLGD